MKRASAALLIFCLMLSPLYAQPGHEVLIKHTVDNAMSPVFNDFRQQSLKLLHDVNARCKTTASVDRESIKSSWKQAYLSWMRAEPFSVGPVKENNRDFNIYFWPVKKSKILPVIDQSLSAADLEEYSIAGKGLAGIEYVLYDTTLELEDEALCRYLLAVSERLSLDAAAVVDGWQGRQGFASLMKNPGRSNKRFLATQDVLNVLLGKVIQHSGGIVKTKLGLSVGKTAAKSKPYKVEARRSALSLQSLLAALDTYDVLLADQAWQAFAGEQGELLQDYIKAQRLSIRDARDIIKQIELPLFELVQQDNASARKLYDAFRQIDSTWKRIARVLNISAGFNDNDGD